MPSSLNIHCITGQSTRTIPIPNTTSTRHTFKLVLLGHADQPIIASAEPIYVVYKSPSAVQLVYCELFLMKVQLHW